MIKISYTKMAIEEKRRRREKVIRVLDSKALQQFQQKTILMLINFLCENSLQ